MESFYFLVPIALIFVAIALRFLFWALNSGQYDNLDTEAHRILFDEDPSPAQDKQTSSSAEPADAQEEAGTTQHWDPTKNTPVTQIPSKERAHD